MIRWPALVALALLLIACRGNGDGPSPASTLESAATGPSISLARVETVDIQLVQAFPVEVNVVAQGTLDDDCSRIEGVSQNRQDNRFRVDITAIRPHDVACSEAQVPFEQAVALDVLGLPAGIYTVDVNGLKGTFTIQEDNRPDPGNAALGGLVWHDLCDSRDGAAEDEQGDCVTGPDGEPQGDGRLADGEPPLPGLVVNLGAGPCPSAGLASTLTDDQGLYLFSGLTAGTYCVSLDAAAERNAAILEPGRWTYPAVTGLLPDLATANADLGPGESRLDLNFGWDYEFTPDPTPQPVDCSDQATFVTDVTVPDNTEIEAGDSLVKIWRLRNDGTCTWTPNYSLVFVDGEQMDGPEAQALGKTVEPGQTVDLQLRLTAPEEPGTYPSFWMLRSNRGVRFGIGPNADVAFWLQIVVP
jgi:hypothetical protein